jgi:energy-coupling factor transporter ATP-binding protein EcfA2
VIVISSEMPEVLHVSDRIVAMYQRRIMREFTAEEVTEDSLIQAISGITFRQGGVMRVGLRVSAAWAGIWRAISPAPDMT